MHRCLIAVVAAGLLASAATLSGAEIKAGFAERDITPAIGMEQPGSYWKVFHRGFHDHCKVHAVVFDDGHGKVALVGVDALALSRHVVLAARKGIQAKVGIAADAILVAASHSHSSGPTAMVQPGEYDGASRDIQDLAYKESSTADAGYLKHVIDEIIQAVSEANAARVPAQLGFGYGHEDHVSFNRRYRMKNGQTWTNPGAMNPDIIGPAGPIDPQVGVVGAWDTNGRLLGAVINFACHPTIDLGGISANWPHYLESTVQGALGTQAPIVFLQGDCGDVTPNNFLTLEQNPKGEEWAKRVGGHVAAQAIDALYSMPRGSDVALEVRQKTWNIKRRAPSAEHVAAAREMVAHKMTAQNRIDWVYAKEIVLADYLAKSAPEVEVEVQAIKVGPAVFVSNPAELFVEYGLRVKKESGFQFTFPVELANGCVGYVPTAEAFGPNGGGYETRITSYSNLDITAGRQFTEAGIALSHEMNPGPAPTFPVLAKPGPAARAGAVGPQLN